MYLWCHQVIVKSSNFMCNHFLYIIGYFIGGGVDYGEVDNGGRYKVTFFAGTNSSSTEIPIVDDLLFEQNEEFSIRVMEELLPFGVKLGENTTTDVKIIDNDSELLICTA